ncbi:MAG: hypothetical protein JWR07_3780 [Nevskia sp.]|nr:hypothetical protein [Nevskia sp.]
MIRRVVLAVVILFGFEQKVVFAQDGSGGLDSILGSEPAAPAKSVPTPVQPQSEAKEKASAQSSGVDSVSPANAASMPQPAQMQTSSSTGQESPATTTQAVSKNRMVEEIVVTAQKREENLQSVPISVQAFSGAMLDAKGIDEPKGLTLTTPGLQYNSLVGYTLVYIRGVGTDAFIPSADGSVATYIDGIYYPFGFGLASALGSVQRIEVLKGPQGTLFGRNSTGGAISIITKQPEPGSELQTSLLVSRESYNSLHARLFTSIPISDTLAISLSGLRYQEDSYYHLGTDSASPGKLPQDISQGFSAKLGWNPLENLKAVFGYTFLNTRGATASFLAAKDPKPLGKLLGVTSTPDFVDDQDAPTYLNTYSRVATADIKYHVPWFDMRFLGGVQHIGPAVVKVDYDGSKIPLVTFETPGQFAHVRTGELQFISNDSSPNWLKWIGGIYYINSSAGYNSIQFSLAPGLVNFLSHPTGLLTGLTSPLLNTLESIPVVGNLLGGDTKNGISLNLAGVLGTVSQAEFAQGTVDFTDYLSLTLGGRFQTETRTLQKSTVAAENPLDNNQLIPVFNFGTKSTSSSSFSPKAVLDFKINEDQHTYMSFSKGFKSGTYNIIAIYTKPAYVPPEVTTTYEVGYKSTLLEGTLKFNAAIFQNNIKNVQIGLVSLTSGGAVNFETAQSAKIQGADFDMTWQVLPESLPGLVITGGGAYLRGRYTNFQNGAGFDNTTGLFFGGNGLLVLGGSESGLTPGRNFTGNSLVRTPTFSGNIGPSYAFDLGQGSMEIAADVYYNSGFYFSAQNVTRDAQTDYAVVNARASYLYQPWGTRLTIFGKNLASSHYYYTKQDFDFDTGTLLAPPFTMGVKLQWDF